MWTTYVTPSHFLQKNQDVLSLRLLGGNIGLAIDEVLLVTIERCKGLDSSSAAAFRSSKHFSVVVQWLLLINAYAQMQKNM